MAGELVTGGRIRHWLVGESDRAYNREQSGDCAGGISVISQTPACATILFDPPAPAGIACLRTVGSR